MDAKKLIAVVIDVFLGLWSFSGAIDFVGAP